MARIGVMSACLQLLLVACTESKSERTALRVYAASSLSEALLGLEGPFEEAHPALDLQLSFAGSQVLAMQIKHGAPADIFIAAKPSHITDLQRSGHAHAPRMVAENRLALVVPTHNPAELSSLADLSTAPRVILGTPDSPIGAYTDAFLKHLSATQKEGFYEAVMARVVSRETNARLVRAKVVLGEADAAIVYETDARNNEDLLMLPLTDQASLQTAYMGAEIYHEAPTQDLTLWWRFLDSDEVRERFNAMGFGTP